MINSTVCKNIRAELQDAVKAIEEKYKVSFNVGSMRFNDNQIRARIEINAKSKDGASHEQEEFVRFAHMYGLKASWIGETVNVQQSRLQTIPGKIIGLNRRARKYPVLVQATNGKTYCMSAEKVIASFIKK